MNWIFRPATPGDWPAIATLLTSLNLPLDGAQEHLDGFLLAFCENSLAGVAGLERYGSTGLLRSVAVAGQNRGLGRELVTRLIDRATAEGLTRIVLLTTTAPDYFPRFGFRRIARQEAPLAVQESIEFKQACPASAVVMELPLTRA
jgi:N-acetylglutamate synthase-like GNAT family acetyltransferase